MIKHRDFKSDSQITRKNFYNEIKVNKFMKQTKIHIIDLMIIKFNILKQTKIKYLLKNKAQLIKI